MSTVKNVTEAKVVSAKTTPIEKALEKKAEVVKKVEAKTEEVKKEVKKEIKKEAKAVKPVVKKAVAKTTEKAAEVKKAVTKNEKTAVKFSLQYADKEYTTEELEKIAKDVWTYDYGKKTSELKNIELYVKPEESKVYYVFNSSVAGAFDI